MYKTNTKKKIKLSNSLVGTCRNNGQIMIARKGSVSMNEFCEMFNSIELILLEINIKINFIPSVIHKLRIWTSPNLLQFIVTF